MLFRINERKRDKPQVLSKINKLTKKSDPVMPLNPLS